MLHRFQLALAILISAAFLLAGWSAIAPASADCMGCDAQMAGMGQMGGKKEMPSPDCMTKASCGVANVKLPTRLNSAAASEFSVYAFPASPDASFETNTLSPDPSPPRFVA